VKNPELLEQKRLEIEKMLNSWAIESEVISSDEKLEIKILPRIIGSGGGRAGRARAYIRSNQQLTQDDWKKIWGVSWNGWERELLHMFEKNGNAPISPEEINERIGMRKRKPFLSYNSAANPNIKFRNAALRYRILNIREGYHYDPVRIFIV